MWKGFAHRLGLTEPHSEFQLIVSTVQLQNAVLALSLPSQRCLTCSRQLFLQKSPLYTNLLGAKQQMDTVLFYPPAAGDEAEGSEPTQKSCGLEKKTPKQWAERDAKNDL